LTEPSNKRAKQNGSNQAKAKDTERPEKPGESTMEFISSMASVLVTGLFIITFIVQAFEIPSKSMVETLLVGDHVFVDRVRFAPPTGWAGWLLPYRQVHRGDIVVFLSPSQPGMYIVKRIRGVPGDRIHLHDGKLYVNGQLQDEPFVVRNGTFDSYRDNFPDVSPEYAQMVTPAWQAEMGSHIENGDLVVPNGRYFGMGDNRDISLDSRYWGFIPRENMIGTPLFTYWSFETPEDQYEKTAFVDRAKFIGHVLIHFFDQTRWRRMLKMVR
jgi:signal peptidase I